MTIAVYLGCKATKQTKQTKFEVVTSNGLGESTFTRNVTDNGPILEQN